DGDLVAFLGVSRDRAEPGLVDRFRLETDVEGASGPAADPDAAASTDDAVISRAVGHGQVERGVAEDSGSIRAGVFVGEPRPDDLDHSFAEQSRSQGSAVEENRVGSGGDLGPNLSSLPDQLGLVATKEGGEVFGNG